MECSFEDRKQEFEAECLIEDGLFSKTPGEMAEFMKPFVANFVRQEQRDHATTVIRGLCSDLKRKNAESIAYHFAMHRKTIQHFLGESEWDDELLRRELASQIAEQLGTADGVLVFDASGFPKSGKGSVGVARQWCGRLGKVDNCQVGVYLAYVSSKGHALVDGELYLPNEWTTDKKRMKKARIPKRKQKFRTRLTICHDLLDQHADRLPHQWIAGDDKLGRPIEFRRKLHARGEQYLLAVPSNTVIRDLKVEPPEYQGKGRHPVRPSVPVARWIAEQPANAWQRLDVRDAEKGPLIIELLKHGVETGTRRQGGVSEETLVVIRYRDRDEAIVKQDYYLSNASATTPSEEFGRVAKAAHRVEECFDRGKGETGMADYEVRNYIGSIIRLVYRCDSPRVVNHRVETRLRRNQQARLCHWKHPNRLAPLNLERRQI